jgi:hypothetical protein
VHINKLWARMGELPSEMSGLASINESELSSVEAVNMAAESTLSSHWMPRAITISRSPVTYALPGADLGNGKMAENWRARQDSNLRPQA